MASSYSTMHPYQMEVASHPILRIRTPRVETDYDSEGDAEREERITMRKNRTFYSVMAISSLATILMAIKTCKGSEGFSVLTTECQVALPIMGVWLLGSICMYIISCDVGSDYGKQYYRMRREKNEEVRGAEAV
jgi:hypothetical protein